ncbi:MAG TPA: ANTAR domain-containing protein, partial [Streptosporangiaceae bacterium]|nr:ANTAR domain-containing protein [Streptosporangiaceae bacterium]
IIEQAKGKLAERLGLDMDQAFSVLRGHARTRNLRLSDVALAFVDGSEILARPGAAQEHPARRDRLPPG